ncbi:hypothetical protein ACFL0D_08200 [Thermoproteota archaeon]
MNSTQKEVVKLGKKVFKEEEKLTSLQEQTRSEENKLSEIKARNAYWRDGSSLVEKAFIQGFSVNILIGLLEALFRLTIKGEPITSARRLLRRLEKVKEEWELDESIKKASSQLATLKNELAQTRAIFNTLRRDVLGKIVEAQQKTINSIASVSEQAKRSISDASETGLSEIQRVGSISKQNIEDFKAISVDALYKQQAEIFQIFYNNHNAIQLSINMYSDSIKKYTDLTQEAAALEFHLAQTILLFGPLTSPNAILALDPQLVRQIMHRIHLYITKKLHDVKTKAPKHIAQREMAINEYWDVNLTSISEFLAVELDRFLSGG